jgi:hypothetical protein
MAFRREVKFGVLLVAPLWLAGCSQQAAQQPVATATDARGQSQPELRPVPDGAGSAANLPPASASSRVFIDPVTGEQRAPTPAEAKAAAQSSAAKAAGDAQARQKLPVEEIAVPGGFTEVRVGERAMREEQVCVQPDDTLSACNDKP